MMRIADWYGNVADVTISHPLGLYHMMADTLQQVPAPGTRMIRHAGDRVTFTLDLGGDPRGTGWLRTNIGRAAVRARERVQFIERGAPILAHDWHDVPLRRVAAGRYAVTLPLFEVGRFEAKALFLAAGESEPVWPPGGNTVIKVEPAGTWCANSLYSAFVRQFGEDAAAGGPAPGSPDLLRQLDAAGYTVIPRSGTFRDLIRRLDVIVGDLRFRIVQLLPIHPVPTTYARMGRFGSPFAALDFLDVDPALAEFDRRTTPLDQFGELVDAVHRREARVFLDMPVNHTGWASKLQVSHPEWFMRNADRSFRSPGAWGVTWEDLSHLDYAQRGLWRYMADVFRFWCHQGVDGFRCDAGYMLPGEAWEYIIARVRLEYPDTVFLLEGLGGKLEVVDSLLADANLDWAYSELFQNEDRSRIESYLPAALESSRTAGRLIHFAETHDNNRLAATSPAYARMRTALAALGSMDGGFGITGGVEWYATDKVDVHEAPPINWGNPVNQVDAIARLNVMLEAHPCFHPGTDIRLIQQDGGNVLAVRRTARDGRTRLLALINLGAEPDTVRWNTGDWPVPDDGLTDLLGGGPVRPAVSGSMAACRLAPYGVLCLTPVAGEMSLLDAAGSRRMTAPVALVHRRLRAKALELHAYLKGLADISDLDPDAMAGALADDPAAFCARLASTGSMPALVRWVWPRDVRRVVMVPPGHLLYVRVPVRFRVRWSCGELAWRTEESLPASGGDHFALLVPPGAGRDQTTAECTLDLTVFAADGVVHETASLLCLDRWDRVSVPFDLTAEAVAKADACAICTNGRGALSQVRGRWGAVSSQYDALLAANLHPGVPVDRHVCFTVCRAWLVYRGYSHAITINCLDRFSTGADGGVRWVFSVPAGNGRCVRLDIRLRMIAGSNAIRLEFVRRRLAGEPDGMDDGCPVRLILRPDIEDRNFHTKTKAFTGPEQAWRHAVERRTDGFVFRPAGDRSLVLGMTPGRFVWEPEWRYMVAHPVEADRGLDGCSDLFSPGYFECNLRGGERAELSAAMMTGRDDPPVEDVVSLTADPEGDEPVSLDRALIRSIRDFIVRRDQSRTVIAGYPWFLDWGRDTLICLRGMIAAGWLAESRDIIRQFAGRESGGTLPNMIRGADDSNRDTSDAPLWMLVACEDLVAAEGSADVLQADCGGRPLREVLRSIVCGYRDGTVNGIRMDPETGLVFSPSHFTWMDTNFPAGTPRQGYPIEIQALWYRALSFVGRLEPEGPWMALADRVRSAVMAFYPLHEGYLSDCLHAAPGQGARRAVADDALRPNQLMGITLGLVNDPVLGGGILSACEELLVPGAIRSLAERPVRYPVPVRGRDGLLNDPLLPYWGRYRGDEDTRRKPAYHNGTAWTWQFPLYAEALFQVYGEPVRDTALALLGSSARLMKDGCIGHLPEIVDGDAPHGQRGCHAQAWGETELLRVIDLLTGNRRHGI